MHPMCAGSESMDHLLLGCVFSREIWSMILRRLHLDSVINVHQENFFSWWLQARGFDSLAFLVGWSIWKERIVTTFGGPSTQPMQLLEKIVEEAKERDMHAFVRCLCSSSGKDSLRCRLSFYVTR